MSTTQIESDSPEASSDRVYHVVYAWDYVQWGGAQIYTLSIIRNAPSNWKFTLVIPKASKPDLIRFFEPYGVNFEFVDLNPYQGDAAGVAGKVKRRLGYLRASRAMYRHLAKYKAGTSVIHFDTAAWQSFILLYSLTLRTHVFCVLHNALSTSIASWRARIWRFRLGFLMKQKRFHLFAANQNAIDSAWSYMKGSDVEKIVLTRATINPLEIDEVLEKPIDRNSIRERLGLSPEKFLVMCIGQFIDRKGRWVFLEAAKKILGENRDIAFVWITPQPATAEEQAKIEGFGLGDSFRLILSKDVGETRKEVLTFFRAADVFALPSLWEGLPISILESMALSVPTISTNITAIPEAIKDMETGLLIEAGDADALVKAILRLKNEPELRERLARDGRKYVLEHFDEREAARAALGAYEACFADA